MISKRLPGVLALTLAASFAAAPGVAGADDLALDTTTYELAPRAKEGASGTIYTWRPGGC